LAKIDRPAREKIGEKIDSLQQDPRPAGIEPLKGWKKYYRLRVGVYRVVYEIEDNILLVLVVRIGWLIDLPGVNA
jgi:mRNA interferase RelE/StbE